MRHIFGALMLLGLSVAMFGGCTDHDDSDGPTGSVECCKARRLCMSCICTDQQTAAGQADHQHPCQLVLEQWDGTGCTTCQEKNCLSGC